MRRNETGTFSRVHNVRYIGKYLRHSVRLGVSPFPPQKNTNSPRDQDARTSADEPQVEKLHTVDSTTGGWRYYTFIICLNTFLQPELQPLKEKLEACVNHDTISYDLLWLLFHEGTDIIFKDLQTQIKGAGRVTSINILSH